MSVIYEDLLNREIGSGKISNSYILFGNDSYLKKFYFDKIASKSYGGDPFFNLQKFDYNSDLQEVYDAVKQYPMMADSKCVTLTDYDFEHASKSDFDKLCELFDEIESGCVFILRFDTVEFDAKRSSRAKKLISSAEKNSGVAVCLDHRNTQILTRMLINGAKKRNCELSESVASYMIQTLGEDIGLLQNELEKLCAFSNGNAPTKETVDNVCVRSAEASVYDYVNAIVAGNLSAAMKMLDDMFYMRLEPMIIFYTACGVFIDMFRVYAASKNSVSRAEVATAFGYKSKSFLLDKAANNLKKMDFNKMNLAFSALLDADRQLKSYGSNPRTVLEQLTVKLGYIIVKGETGD